MIRLLLVLSYITSCFKMRVAPWKYFQLNSPYFNEQRDIFSKLDMDSRIPDQWRLHQFLDIGDQKPPRFPVFVKPEWGQNSRGIERADSMDALLAIRQHRLDSRFNYLIQEAAPGLREFEVFVIPSTTDENAPAVMSITETLNRSADTYPINGIYNQDTYYSDISEQMTQAQQKTLWGHLKQMGHYRIARYGIRADSLNALLGGRFHIIEINLFLPMPLVLLAEERNRREKIQVCLDYMKQLAKITGSIPPQQPHKPVFFKNLKKSKSLKLITNMRSHNERA